jgi:hypothetical protein
MLQKDFELGMPIDIIRYAVNRGNFKLSNPTGLSLRLFTTSARGIVSTMRRREQWVVCPTMFVALLICACANYKDKRYGKKSGILKADFIDLLINYRW